MNIQDYFEQMPAVAPIKGAKAHINFKLTEDEYDLIQKLVHHPALKMSFEGTIQNCMRWIIGYTAFQLYECVEEMNPQTFPIVSLNRLASRELVASYITKWITERTIELHLLLDVDMTTDAINLYRDVLAIIRKQPTPWDKAFETVFFKNAEIERFRVRLTLLNMTDKLLEVEKYAGS